MTNESISTNDGQITDIAQPKWIRIQQVVSHFGISRTKAFQLASEGKITSVSLREPGMTKATRLFLASSIDDYICSFLPDTAQTTND